MAQYLAEPLVDWYKKDPVGSLFTAAFPVLGLPYQIHKSLNPPKPVLVDESSKLPPPGLSRVGIQKTLDEFKGLYHLQKNVDNSKGNISGAPTRRSGSITSPNTITQAADDTYKQLLSQYGGQVGVSQLAGQTSLPTGFTPEGGKQAASLKDYYAAQQAVGAKNIGDIISSMGYTGPMAEWAKANPMLAQREFAKRRATGVRTEQDVTDEAMQKAAAKGQYFAPFGGPIPDPVAQQREQQYQTAFQAGLGTKDTSASQRSMDFLKKFGIGTLNPDSYNFSNESGVSPYSKDSLFNLNIKY